jgi:GAF domain-containing protein
MLDQTALLLLIKDYQNQQLTEVQFYRQLTETITLSLQCSRASLWLYADTQLDEIVAVDLFDHLEQSHQQGMRLHEKDFAPYFAAMRAEGGINAPQARDHAATSCLTERYFNPNQIVSLLDVGIHINGQLVGVFCCEQVGTEMQWTSSQKIYLQQAGKLITFALKPLLLEKLSAVL